MHLPGQPLALRFLGLNHHFNSAEGAPFSFDIHWCAPVKCVFHLSHDRDQAFQILLIALELFELSTHHKKPLLRIKRRVIRCPNLLAWERVKLRNHLLKIRSYGSVPLSKLVHFQLTLFDQQGDLFKFFFRLLQLGLHVSLEHLPNRRIVLRFFQNRVAI